MFKILIVLILLLAAMVGVKYKLADTSPNKTTSILQTSKLKDTQSSISQTNKTTSSSIPTSKLTNTQTSKLVNTQTNKPANEPLTNAKKSGRRVSFAKKSLRRDITPEGKFIEYKLDVKK